MSVTEGFTDLTTPLRGELLAHCYRTAVLLGTTTAAVNSALLRARARLARVLPAEEDLAEPPEPERRDLLERFAAAVENADVSALARLLRDDVTLEMPPALTWFRGLPAVVRFLAERFLTAPGRLRLVPAAANAQSVFAVYELGQDGAHHAHAVIAPALTGRGIAGMVAFADPSLFRLFGLPAAQGSVPT